jgi:hypothetical protein
MLDDGFSTLITFAADDDVAFWEKTVQPPGVDGGDGIDQTTMHNTAWRVMRARQLKTLTDVAVVAAYDPKVYDEIIALVNVEGSITCLFPNNDTLDFYGYLKEFTPQVHEEGTQPEANIVIVCTNWDPSANEEAGPNYKTSLGTD